MSDSNVKNEVKNEQTVLGKAECVVERVESKFTFPSGDKAKTTIYYLNFPDGERVRIYPYSGSKDNPKFEEACKLYAHTL